jgi:hypothetical protein
MGHYGLTNPYLLVFFNGLTLLVVYGSSTAQEALERAFVK